MLLHNSDLDRDWETEQEIFIDTMPRPRRREGIMEAADGGIMEKDMRGGGFIPEGSKERADDVPSSLVFLLLLYCS